MKVSERIADLMKQRGVKITALEELNTKAETEGRTLTDDEQNGFDEIMGAIKSIDGTVDRLKDTESIIARSASPIIVPSRGAGAAVAKGIRFARLCQAIAASNGNFMQAQEISKQAWPHDSDILQVLRAQSFGVTRAAVAAGTTTDPAWAGALVAAQQLSGEIIELVYAESIIGKLTQVRKVPFNVRIARETAAVGTAGWVGQGLSKPVGKGAYDFITMPWAKVALIVIITEELARFSNPAAEGLMRDALVRSIASFLDQQFIDPAVAPVANVSPGSITNGLPAGQIINSAGGTGQEIMQDLTRAVGLMNTTNAPRAPTWLMHPTNLVAIQMQTNALGQPMFPTAANGTLYGYPVVTSAHVPMTNIVLADQAGILLASDDSVTVDVSREASVQMDSAPATPPTPVVSLWQQNLIGLKAEQYAYWMRARDADVVLITNAAYLPVSGGQGAQAQGLPRPAAKAA